MTNDPVVVFIQASIEEVQICPPVTEDELVNDLRLKVMLRTAFSTAQKTRIEAQTW